MDIGPGCLLDCIEPEFLARRHRAPDLHGAFHRAFALVADGLPGGDRALLETIGLAIADAVDAWAGQRPELPYHNRHHAAEATVAMGVLCRSALDMGSMSPMQGAVGVVAMVGHDIGHDGSVTGAGTLEAASARTVQRLAAARGLGGAPLETLADVILGTAPALVAGNAARLQGRLPPWKAGNDLLRVLANEADVSASMMPTLGPRLSRLLMQEWQPLHDPDLLRVSTAFGRYVFLRDYPALSPPAQRSGLAMARQSCLDAYARAGAMRQGPATPESGAAVLDALPRDVADEVYARAVSQVMQALHAQGPAGGLNQGA